MEYVYRVVLGNGDGFSLIDNLAFVLSLFLSF